MKSLSFAALAVLLMVHQAEAQTANSGSSSNSSAGSTSGASSSSGSTSNSGTSSNRQNTRQAATQNTNTPITFNSTSPDRLSTSNSSSGNFNNSGHTTSDVTVRTTPTVYAPPVSGGNPCTLAVSGGVSVIGWGAAAGGTFVDEDCANRQKIAMIHNAGYAAAARELMCNDKATYYAFRGTATPCAPRAAFDGTPPPPTMVQQQPGPVVVTPAVPATRTAGPMPGPQTLPRCNAARGITDNCYSG